MFKTAEGLVCVICGRVYGCSATHQPCPWCECDRLKSELFKLKQDLIEYGDHRPSCPEVDDAAIGRESRCDCGWNELYSKIIQT